MTPPTDADKRAVLQAQAVRAMLEHQQTAVYKDYLRAEAINAFARYQSYVDAGFDAGQALPLTMMYKP